MEQVYKFSKNCCGCAKCESVCPTNAIKMKLSNGHYYPVINKDLCIDCQKCSASCDFSLKADTKPIGAYAVKHNNEVRMNSSSGGLFTALSDYILEKSGKIFGADFDENMHLCHTLADTKEKRDRMRGTKYIQSDMSGVYPQIKSELKNNQPVLFIGTPCQVNAVKGFVGDNENLYTADLICHGVPSPEMWESFIKCVEKKYNKKATYFSFRNKSIAWRKYSGRVTFRDGTVCENTKLLNAYTDLFRYDLTLRPSCENCPFASLSRVGDITLGDFWGIENIFPKIDDNKGVSAVLINTPKGERLFENAKKGLEVFEVTSGQIAAKQPNLHLPSKRSIKADKFENDFKAMPFEKILKKYTVVGIKRCLIYVIKGVLKK